MRVACITMLPDFYPADGFNARLQTEFAARGHDYVKIDPSDVQILYDKPNEFPLRHPLYDLTRFDLYNHVIRTTDDWAWEVIYCLRDYGMPVLRPNRLPFGDKVTIARLFHQAGIRIPVSAICNSLVAAAAAAVSIGFPLVGKYRHGSQGRNVAKIHDEGELAIFAHEALKHDMAFVLQEVILPLGVDIRAFVVGGQVLAAMQRFAAEGDFRANYSLSGKANPIDLTTEETRIALQAAEIYDVNYAGVDIIRTATGPVLLEINKAPGLKGIETITGVNVAAKIVEFYEGMVSA